MADQKYRGVRGWESWKGRQVGAVRIIAITEKMMMKVLVQLVMRRIQSQLLLFFE
jgi:hypothetical protein